MFVEKENNGLIVDHAKGNVAKPLCFVPKHVNQRDVIVLLVMLGTMEYVFHRHYVLKVSKQKVQHLAMS